MIRGALDLVGTEYAAMDCAQASAAVLRLSGYDAGAEYLDNPLDALKDTWVGACGEGGIFVEQPGGVDGAIQDGDVVVSRSRGYLGGPPTLHIHAVYDARARMALSSSREEGVHAVPLASIRGAIGLYRLRSLV